MEDSISVVPGGSRASKEWIAPFKKQLKECTKEDERKTCIEVGDVRRLATATFEPRNSDEGESATNLELLLAELEADTANRVEFRKLGCIPLLVHHMTKNISNKEIQMTCCHVLTSISDRDEEAQKEIGEREGIEAILDVLHRFEGQARVCRAAFATLRGLTLIEHNRKVMIDNGVLKCIVSVLKNCMEDEILVENAVASIARVVFRRNDTREAFGAQGGILLITHVLQRYESSSSIQAEAALAIRNLGFDCHANHNRMNEANTIDVLFRGLRNHIDDYLVTNQTLAAIGNMIAKDSVVKDRILLKRTYVAQIFRSLTAFAMDCCLSCKISSMLLHLCAYDQFSDPFHDRCSVRTVSLCCTEEGGCSAIVDAMEAALEKAIPLLGKLSRLTHELCIDEGFRQKMGEASALRVLLKSFTCENSEVLQDVLLCIGALLSGNDDNKRKFSEIGGFRSVLTVMNTHAANELLIENCCKVFDIGADGQLVTTGEILLQKEEDVAAVLRAMKEFPGNARIQEYSCSLLIKVAAISEEDSSHMVKTGVRDAVETARRTHSGDAAVESLSNQLVSLLGDNRGVRRGRGSTGTTSNSSARLRSRSRTVGNGNRNRSRSRQGGSKSPIRGDRALEAGRRAMLAAKATSGTDGSGTDGSGKVDAAQMVFQDLSVRKSERTAKKKLTLEPISE